MSKEQRVSEAVRFLNNIHGGRQVRLAHAELLNRGKSNQSFVEGKTRFRAWGMGLENWLHRRMDKADEGVEIFYAPTPMKGDTGRKKFQVLPTRVAFSDADYGLSPEVKARLVELGACLVRSGGRTEDRKPKYHVYIKLSRDVGLDELEKINRGLKVFINGDKFDATSLLRIPGTRNHKYQGSPMVRLERLADQTHRPEDMLTWFPVPKDHVSGVELEGMKLPVIPEGFKTSDRKYWRLRKTLLHWNQRFDDPHQVMRRYKATTALVKDAIRYGFSVDVAYGFAMECKPLLDKAEEENGYSIRNDVAKTYYRETKGQSSGLTVEEIKEEAGPDSQAPKEKAPSSSTTQPALADDEIGEVAVPKAFRHEGDGPNPYSAKDNRRYADMSILLLGGFKPMEPTLGSIDGQFCILYPGMTHCIFGDSGSGKTWATLALVAQELRAGKRVKYIDFENGLMTIGNRLANVLQVPGELLVPDRFKYMWFDEKPETNELDEEAEEGYDLVIIDGVDASMALWETDANKPTEVRKWYNEFPQRFADEGSTVLSIDHTVKKSVKDLKPKEQQPGGAGTKLAVLTGAAFYLHPRDGYDLVPGRRGIVEAFVTRKDKDGYLKAKSVKATGHLFNFIIDVDDTGQTVVGFEAASHDQMSNSNSSTASVPSLTDEARDILTVLSNSPIPMLVGKIKEAMGKRSTTVSHTIQDLVERGFVLQEQVGNTKGKNNSITSLGRDALAGKMPQAVIHEGTRVTIDFAVVPDKPADWINKNEGKRECRVCGDHFAGIHLADPDDDGFTYGKPMCKPCAAEGIDREPVDGPEWARKKREIIERDNSPRGRRRRS